MSASAPTRRGEARGPQSAWRLPVVAALLYTTLGVVFFAHWPQLYDNDSYYHLAIAREYAEHGIVDQLPQLRFSALGQGLGDKELLFHLVLAPFAAGADLARTILGGQIALALFCGAVAALLVALTRPVLGRLAVALPLLLALCSTELTWRLVRLRPELGSLLLLLVALWCIGLGRYRWLGLVTLLYTLSYTAFHALLGLCGLIFLFRGLVRRRWQPALVLYAGLGAAIGLVVHPHFPDNLTVWWLQSWGFFADKALLDVGTEIRPNFSDVVLLVNLPLYALLAVLWRARTPLAPATPAPEDTSALADAFGVGAVVFGALYLLMSRFSVYAFPLLTIWIVLEIGRRGGRLGPRCRLPGGRSAPTWLAVALVLLVAVPEATRQVRNYARRIDPGPEQVRLTDRKALASALPDGAKVAARWQQTPIFMLWAPDARYLNVLDPVFMARSFPAEHRAQARLFRGEEPDVPRLLTEALDSPFLAYSLAAPTGRLSQRLAGDPRLTLRHRQVNALWQVTGATDRFVRAWRLAPATATPPEHAAEISAWPVLAPPPGSVAAFVDLYRADAECRLVAHLRDGPGTVRWELAPWGPTTLWHDHRLVVATADSPGAILGRGLELELTLHDGANVIAVRTCPARLGRTDAQGFYLLELPEPTS